MATTTRAYDQGYKAYEDCNWNNPYVKGSLNYREWQKGFEAAESDDWRNEE